MTSTAKIYTFRSGPWGTGNTPVTVAPMEHVMAIFGDGGLFGEGGLSLAFDHVAIFRDDTEVYFGVWGTVRSSRFRIVLEKRFALESVDGAPRARLTYWAGQRKRSARQASTPGRVRGQYPDCYKRASALAN